MPRRRRKVNFLATSLSCPSTSNVQNHQRVFKEPFKEEISSKGESCDTNYLCCWENPSLGLSFFICTISGLDKGASYLNVVYLNPLISFHFTCAASASTEPGRKDCPFYACLTLFLFYKCSLCVSCPNTITPRCPVFISFLFF